MRSPQSVRLWPGVAAAAVMVLLRFVMPRVYPDGLFVAVMSGLAGGLVILLWWTFFSRVAWQERLVSLAIVAAAMAATARLVDKSIATGMMGMMFYIVSVPVMAVAFVAWAVFFRNWRGSLVATVLLVCGGFLMVRTNGINGDADSDFAWRWAKTHEEKLAEIPAPLPVPVVTAEVAKTETALEVPKPAIHWSGFRGPARDGVIPGIRIRTDWTVAKPVELWRKAIGPGWGSFAAEGDLIYTQEQRGEDEVVACYNATTGNPVWTHKDAARFWESNAGPGPRATPALHGGRVYTFGGTGIVNALDAMTGAVIWTRNPATENSVNTPEWGFSSSPLVVGDLVVIAVSGQLAAYEAATGVPRWLGPAGVGGSYSSPHRVTLDSVPQIVLASGHAAIGVAPADGTVLWKHEWPPAFPIVQPAVTEDGDLLFGAGDGIGLRRIAVKHAPDGTWTTEERWMSAGLKPYFSDSVVYQGHAFGFDGSILSCIDLKDGKRIWKGGRYGHGQFVLLRDQGVLLVLSEDGGLALVNASTDQFKELARFPAMEGKTWNHPVLAGDRLIIRNGTEMVAFKLAIEGR